MNAIEIRNLSKSFRGMYALDNLNMTVPVGAIYGFIGENGSGKSTTEKLICGHLVPDKGEIKLFGKEYTDAGVRVRMGALIESAGCFPNSSVWTNLMMQALNLGMKQRIGIAMALLGDPALLILDEPINGLDTDGMRIMREILVDITQNLGCTVLISSHILGELEKIATHYGIIRQGRMVQELSAAEMDARSRVYVSLKTRDMQGAKGILKDMFYNVRQQDDSLIIYDAEDTEAIVVLLMKNGHAVSEITKNRIGLEEYYIDLMSKKEVE